MRLLRVNSITCYNQQEEGHGKDEIRLWLDGDGSLAKRWTGSIGKGQTVYPGVLYEFQTVAAVTLYEDDVSPNQDEVLYRARVFHDRRIIVDFRLPGSNYDIDYSIS